MRTALACLCLAALTSVAQAQSTWYVDAASTPPGSGTLADPYSSLQYAIDRPTTLAHDTILVAPGTYAEALDLLTKPLRVISTQGPLATRIEPPPTSSIGVRLGPWGADATTWVFEGFTVRGNAVMTVGVRGTGTLRRCIVRDVTAGSTAQHAALFTDYDLIVEECTVVGNRVGLASGTLDGIYYAKNTLVHGSAVVDVDSALVFISSSLDHCTWGTGDAPQVWGVGNLKGNPGFWNAAQGDLRLAFGSSSIDSGDPTSPLDPDGSTIDRGALTFDAGYLPAITIYCTAKTNSQGCAAAIGLVGGPAASASAAVPFQLTAGGVVTDTVGLLFYGYGRGLLPFVGGFHCVQPPTPRTGAQVSGNTGAPCSGAFAFDFNAHLQAGIDAKLKPGVMVNAQYWYRDTADPLGFGSATSDAIEFPIAP